jgi:hypothetical protein
LQVAADDTADVLCADESRVALPRLWRNRKIALQQTEQDSAQGFPVQQFRTPWLSPWKGVGITARMPPAA